MSDTTSTTADRKLTEGTALPTQPCSVVWSDGRAFVLEPPVWVGLDHRGRLARLTPAALQRQGWSHDKLS
ncbi:hypothetical protein [Actinokineospora bangkokensis]|uniref:Uncharacterized protein n=1 Tax=Actinokineospora bangkokensis TaxID=1193682 RepID=A0A1Q9LR46_9PSEU|nr:hypothetical protein [Actinokineospora bangkokensis]OLR94527.1 hypothetical protein BJP25_12350 [Actinokineospora bangkokensis]